MFNFIKRIFKKEEPKTVVNFIDDKYVVVTIDGKSSIELRKDYEEITPSPFCIVIKNGKWKGMINTEADELLPPIYDDIRVDGDTVYAAKNGRVEKYSLEELLKNKN